MAQWANWCQSCQISPRRRRLTSSSAARFYTSLAQITRKYITKTPQGEWDCEMSQPPLVYLRYNPMGISSRFAPARENPLKENGVARCPSLRQCVCDICGAILPYRLVAGSPQWVFTKAVFEHVSLSVTMAHNTHVREYCCSAVNTKNPPQIIASSK